MKGNEKEINEEINKEKEWKMKEKKKGYGIVQNWYLNTTD